MTDHHSDKVIYLSDYGVGLGDMEWFTDTLFSSGMILPRENKAAQEVSICSSYCEAISCTHVYDNDRINRWNTFITME